MWPLPWVRWIRSTLSNPIFYTKILLYYLPKWSLHFRSPTTEKLYTFLISPCVLHARSYESPWFSHLTNIWCVLTMKLLIMQNFQSSFYFFSLRPKYSPRILFSNTLPSCERPSFAPRYNCSFEYLYLFLRCTIRVERSLYCKIDQSVWGVRISETLPDPFCWRHCHDTFVYSLLSLFSLRRPCNVQSPQKTNQICNCTVSASNTNPTDP